MQGKRLSTKVRKKQMIQALEKNLGVVSAACAAVGLSRQQHYDWLKEDDQYRGLVNELKSVCLDFAESKLFARIKKEDTTAIIFYLKSQGKDRGYQETSSMDLTSDGGPIIPFVIQQKPDGV